MIYISERLFSIEDDEIRFTLRPYFSDRDVLFCVLMSFDVRVVVVWGLIGVEILLAH